MFEDSVILFNGTVCTSILQNLIKSFSGIIDQESNWIQILTVNKFPTPKPIFFRDAGLPTVWILEIIKEGLITEKKISFTKFLRFLFISWLTVGNPGIPFGFGVGILKVGRLFFFEFLTIFTDRIFYNIYGQNLSQYLRTESLTIFMDRIFNNIYGQNL